MNVLNTDVRFSRPNFALDVRQSFSGAGVCALIGASGSGKSTFLRLIAGLERPDEGRISMGGKIWTDARRKIHLKPQSRNIGMLFQDYALFDHMSAKENIGFGVPKAYRAETVKHWVEALGLNGVADRLTSKLSGGQRQRVALARALATDPDLLLLDEPFSALDPHLRLKLRTQVKELLTRIKQPAIIVTHDLQEARAMADHVGVMVDGSIRRFGDPFDVFSDPGDYQTATVLGWRNILPAASISGKLVAGPWGRVVTKREAPVETAWIGIRPEHIQIGLNKDYALEATITSVSEFGAFREIACRLDSGHELYVHRPWNEPVPAPGETTKIVFPENHIRFMGDGAIVRNTEEPAAGDVQTGLRQVENSIPQEAV